MKLSKSRCVKSGLYLLLLIGLSACQSSSPKVGDNPDVAAELQRLKERQQEQDRLLEELQQMRPGLMRLAVIEEELYLLIERLQALSETQTPQTVVAEPTPAPAVKPAVTVKPPAPRVAEPVSTPVVSAPLVAPAVASDSTPVSNPDNFALQIASVTDPLRLQALWRDLTRKHPQLLADMEPNFQKVHVRDSNYYRLKIGSFGNKEEAAEKCTDLKNTGMVCLVVSYTASNFSQIVNQ